jgi:hypothetical protein
MEFSQHCKRWRLAAHEIGMDSFLTEFLLRDDLQRYCGVDLTTLSPDASEAVKTKFGSK